MHESGRLPTGKELSGLLARTKKAVERKLEERGARGYRERDGRLFRHHEILGPDERQSRRAAPHAGPLEKRWYNPWND